MHHLLLTVRLFFELLGLSGAEKLLRDEAAAEVAKITSSATQDEKARKRNKLSEEEKSQQNRDRNREHARNTRLRKKAYVAKVSKLVDELRLQKQYDVQVRNDCGQQIFHNVYVIVSIYFTPRRVQ